MVIGHNIWEVTERLFISEGHHNSLWSSDTIIEKSQRGYSHLDMHSKIRYKYFINVKYKKKTQFSITYNIIDILEISINCRVKKIKQLVRLSKSHQNILFSLHWSLYFKIVNVIDILEIREHICDCKYWLSCKQNKTIGETFKISPKYIVFFTRKSIF